MEKKKSLYIIIIIIVFIGVITPLMLNRNNIKENSNSNSSNSNNIDSTDTTNSKINRYSELSDIVFEDDKVNIYFFWGNGCSHCEEQFAFLDDIQEEYGNYFNAYAFEVWYNQTNAEILADFAEANGDTVKGVPYTIIGEKSFNGFGSSIKSEYKKTIIEQVNKDYDVYNHIIKK